MLVNSLSARRRHPLAVFGVLIVALATTGAVFALLSGGSRAQAAQGRSLAIDEGRKLFVNGCSSCHGINAQGTTDGPSLIGVGAAAIDFQVGTGRMPAQ